MKKVICSRCKQRPAVIFISKIIDGKTVPEGLCLNCAMEMNIGPIKQMMDSMGITEDDVEALSEQFTQMFPDDDEDGSFESGGSPTLPFLQGLMGDLRNGLMKAEKPENMPSPVQQTSSSSQVKQMNFLICKLCRHFTSDNFKGKTLGNCSFTYTGFTYKAGVIL